MIAAQIDKKPEHAKPDCEEPSSGDHAIQNREYRALSPGLLRFARNGAHTPNTCTWHTGFLPQRSAMADSGTDDTFVREAKRLMRGIRRRQARQAGGRLITFSRPRPGTEPGILIVQLDGVAEPVLRWADENLLHLKTGEIGEHY